MASDIPANELFELKLVFLRELESGYQRAREAHARLIKGDAQGIEELFSFFHRIAGTASAMDFGVLGYASAMSEDICNLARKGRLSTEEAARLLADALAGVATLLDEHGSAPPTPSPARALVEPKGLTQPDSTGEERVLSKILVIDDDPFSAHLIDSCLRSAGFLSSYCCSPSQALQQIQAELPDLIILDVVMPEMDGFELCRRVRSHPALQFTPIIFVTRRGDVDQRVRGLEVGGNDYIAKPFEPQELVARVRAHLSRLASLRDMVIRDGLTRCFNHKYFKARLEQEISRARRYKGEVALGLLDVDHFKLINDKHGHLAGDAVLAHLSSLVVASVRSTDVVARYGGEEFGILLIQAGAAEASIITNRIRERIAKTNFQVSSTNPVEVPVTVSIGVAQLSPEESMEQFIRRADSALYEAKKLGRNQVRIAGSTVG